MIKMSTIRKTSSFALAKELGKEGADIIQLGNEVTDAAERSVAAKGIVWYVADAAERIRQAVVSPLTVAKRYRAFALYQARNPRWMFCSIEGLPGKHPVMVPRKLMGRLNKKHFEIEAIQDIQGTTYRHASLATNLPRLH